LSIQNNKYWFFSLITGLSVLISPLFAQEEFALTLTINDSEDQVPLEGVTVLIEPCGCGGITNVSGIFNKRLAAGTYTLTIDYLGYGQQILTIDLNKSQSLAVGMRVVEEQLSEVVLLAEQQNNNIESPQMGVLELNVRDLIKVPAAMGEFDILKSITLMAGVNSSGDISNGVSIRGGSLDQNLLLYDGAPVFNPTHLFGLFSVFTPDVISGVDIYRANIPAKYGGRIASVVEVKVKNPYTDRFKLEGGLGLISNRLSITTPLVSNKLMITAGVRTGFSDLLFPLLIPRLKNTRANFLDSTVKLLYLLNPNNQFSYTYFLSDDFYQLDLISSIENIVSSSNQYDFSTRNHSLKWLHTFKNETNLTTRFIQSTYTPQNLFPELESDNSIVYKSQIKYSNLQSEFTNYKNENWSFYGGLDLKRYLLAPGSLDPGNGNSINPVILNQEEGFEASLYSSLEWNPTPALSLSAGLRLTQFLLLGPFEEAQYTPDDTYENSIYFDPNEKVISYFNPEPRLGLNYKLTENTAVKASYARIFQYIQNIYNTNTPLPTSRWKISDRYIKPQENSTYGFGVYQNLLEGMLELSAEGYYRQTRNNLTYKPGADFFLSQFIENEITQAQGKAYGIEFSLRKKQGKVNGVLNYTWSRSLLKTEEENPADRINNNFWFASDFDRPHTVNATVNFEGDQYNSFSFNFVGQTGRPYTIANGIFEEQNITIPIYLYRNNARLPTYHRLDFSWKIAYSKDPKNRFKGDWIFTVYNLYSRKNPFNIYYTQRNGVQDGNVFLGSPLGAYELSILRGALVSLTYNFKFQ
jgi:hypothetical protein